MDWESGVNKCKLLHLEWISNEILLYSTGNYLVTCDEKIQIIKKMKKKKPTTCKTRGTGDLNSSLNCAVSEILAGLWDLSAAQHPHSLKSLGWMVSKFKIQKFTEITDFFPSQAPPSSHLIYFNDLTTGF